MTSEWKDDGGSAFPSWEPHADYGSSPIHGMSLRDHFAGRALAGFCNNPEAWAGNWTETAKDMSRIAYAIADSMLAERTKAQAVKE